MPPNEQLVIEPPSVDELDSLADCWVDLAREQRAHGSHVLPDANRDRIRSIFGAHHASETVLVARLDGTLVGFGTFAVERGALEIDSDRGHLSNLYVKPSFRGRTIGTALLRAIESTLTERGVSVLTLEVLADNEAARRFYRSNGYTAQRISMEHSLESGDENDTHSKVEE